MITELRKVAGWDQAELAGRDPGFDRNFGASAVRPTEGPGTPVAI